MKIMMICNSDGALYVFRKPLIARLLSADHTVGSITGETSYVERLSRLGVKASVVDFEGNSVSIFGIVRLLRQLHRLLSSDKPDMVHSFTHKPAIYGTLAAYCAGVRSIYITITGLGTLFSYDDVKTRMMRQLLLLQYRIALRFATSVFFQNPDDMKYFLDRKLITPDRAVLTCGSGIDVTEFSGPTAEESASALRMLGRELGLELGNKMIVIFPARALREKGFYEFYEAARTINRRSGDYLFLHLGLVDEAALFGNARQHICSYARDCGVHFLGFKENIKEYMSASDIVALPSSYREGVPRSLIEALALDKYIITTDAPGCRETVVDGWNGAFCKSGDPDDLVLKITGVTRDLIRENRGRSRALCEKRFDVELLIKSTFSCYFGTETAHG